MPSVAPWGLGLWVIHVKLSETVTHQRCRIGLVLDLLDDSQVLDFAFSDFLEFLWHILKSISRVRTISCQGADESWWVLLGFDRDLRILRFLENHGNPEKSAFALTLWLLPGAQAWAAWWCLIELLGTQITPHISRHPVKARCETSVTSDRSSKLHQNHVTCCDVYEVHPHFFYHILPRVSDGISKKKPKLSRESLRN